ncbi:hypothetical protein AWB64_01747 [Caballeronia sordidicola]|uniref:Uncharacterized protein n=1 Tax=Caballeronia sordidicola TaxID=196367 RepID=A0A158FSG2_CABSO|nr:hypothetical protein [Caballeronia sordidicola]SAL22764.1 hypothetical protein AWB64_01747 [Caballeronia sordidicola]
MQKAYLNRLAPDVRALAEDLEYALGFEIIVKVNQHLPRRAADEPGGLECEVDQSGARIVIPDPDWFPDGSVLHELFHVRRFLLEGIPLLVDNKAYVRWNPCVSSAVTYHDNCMEHLVIVPEELGRRPERLAHWERAIKQVWGTLAVTASHEADCRQGALVNWAFIEHVLPDSATRREAVTVLDRLGFREAAACFADALAPVLNDKEKLVKRWFEHLHLQPEMASLRYLNVWDNACRETPLNIVAAAARSGAQRNQRPAR